MCHASGELYDTMGSWSKKVLIDKYFRDAKVQIHIDRGNDSGPCLEPQLRVSRCVQTDRDTEEASTDPEGSGF